MNERWRRVEDLFHGACAQAPAARGAWLAVACGEDQTLRAEVERLLRAETSADDAFTRLETHTRPEAADPLLARTLGPYRLTARLATGGMGVVYRGERTDGLFEQEVAIKLIRADHSTTAVRRRFELERRTLAALQHPSIARLYDGGTTDDGHPYLVMELVRGEPIDAFCSAHRLAVPTRLRLFVQVCRAVQYAHQCLVVHCDIKPANILIDERGVPHLLDFGIARLLGSDTVTQPRAEPAATALTPAYASPEQRAGAPPTTAVDVFALGVVLVELLTGQRPSATGTAERDLPGVFNAAARHLPRALRNDLLHVARKSLQPSPHDRYRSVQEFADDVERALGGRPVSAHPPSLLYQAARFARRHRLVAAASATAIAALVYGLVAARRGEQRAHAEAEHAHTEADSFHSIADFLMDAFLPTQPADDAAWQQRAHARILAHAARVDRQYADVPHMRANLLDMLGQVCARLDLYEDATRLVQQAMDLRARTFGEQSLEYALSLRSAGQVKFRTGAYAEAAELLERALPLHRAAPTHPHADVAAVANDLAACLRNLGRDTEAEALHLEALALRRADGDDTLAVAESLNNLAAVHQQRGEFAAAAQELRQALSARAAILGNDHSLTLQTTANLAVTLWRCDHRDEALALMQRVADGYRDLGSDGEDELGQTLANLATMQIEAKALDDAATSLDRALALQVQRLGEQHPLVAITLSKLAVLHHARHDDARARQDWADVLRLRRAPGTPARDLAEALYGYGVFLYDLRDLDAAVACLDEVVALHRDASIEDPLALARTESVLGRCYQGRREVAQAREHLNAAIRLFDALTKPPEAERARVRQALAELER
ncbi:MAG: serine/threonine-protein kinase [Planctomycetota bacterium]